jgi:hypothetical protein
MKMDKNTIAKILAYVEKNCTGVAEVEEYLWEQLDKAITREIGRNLVNNNK